MEREFKLGIKQLIKRHYIILLVIVNSFWVLLKGNHSSLAIIILLVAILLFIIKIKKDMKLKYGLVDVILIEGEYGSGKTTYVEKNYSDKRFIINLYEESSSGNFLRDMYYEELSIVKDGFLIIFLFFLMIKISNYDMIISISIGMFLYLKYFIYITNYFIKVLILENKFYMNALIEEYEKYDYIIFEDIDRLDVDEQKELLRIISYFKKNLLSTQKLICVGNMQDIDIIFIDKFITEKVVIDKKEQIKEWMEKIKEFNYVKEYIELFEEILKLFLEKINYRFFDKFIRKLEELEINNENYNLINSFLTFYFDYYLKVNIKNNLGIFKKEFSMYEIENIIGTVIREYDTVYSSTLIKNVKEIIILSNIDDWFFILELKTLRGIGVNELNTVYDFKIVNFENNPKEVISNKTRNDKAQVEKIDDFKKEIIYVLSRKFNPVYDNFMEDLYRKLSGAKYRAQKEILRLNPRISIEIFNAFKDKEQWGINEIVNEIEKYNK